MPFNTKITYLSVSTEASRPKRGCIILAKVCLSSMTFGFRAGFRALLRPMPSKTPAKRASARRKPVAKKSNSAHKNGNGAKSKSPDFEAAFEAQKAEQQKTANDLAA